MNMEVTSNQMADEIETCEYCDRIVATPNFAYHICTGRKLFKGSRPTKRAPDLWDSAPFQALSTDGANPAPEHLSTPPTSG
jgi:hypothetical protein